MRTAGGAGPPPVMERRGLRGLGHLGGWLFWGWGSLAAGKGLYDMFLGQPEANLFSPEPWQFVTRAQWLRYAGFEFAYGLACLGVGIAIRIYARRLPVWVEREAHEV